MAEVSITIEATDRTQTGKGYARKLRKNGKIPANLLVKGKSTLLELDPKWLGKAYSEGKKFNLSYKGEVKPVVITEVQIDVLKRTPLHVDLKYAN